MAQAIYFYVVVNETLFYDFCYDRWLNKQFYY
jgi:hypothetical protein